MVRVCVLTTSITYSIRYFDDIVYTERYLLTYGS